MKHHMIAQRTILWSGFSVQTVFREISQLATHLKLAHSAKSNGKTREILIQNNENVGTIEVK